MRILFVITELEEGGAEHALGQVATCLHRAGQTVAVAALAQGTGPVAARLRAVGIPVHGLGLTRAWQIGRLWRLRRLVARFRPDLVNSWLFHANLAARLLVPRRLPVVASLRVVEPRALHVRLERWTRARVGRFLCVSEDVARFACDRIGIRREQCCVIENGVDFDAYAAARATVRDDTRLSGLTVARVSAQKGLDILVRGLAAASADMGAWEWHFVGAEPDPKTAGRLRDLADRLGIGAHLHWHGPVSRQDLVRFYGQANLFALPSRWEGQPNVVLEAMAAAVPVLASRTDGVADLLEREPDCLAVVEPNRADAWARLLAQVWADRGARRRRRDAGCRLASDRGWADVAARHLACYQYCLNNGADAGLS